MSHIPVMLKEVLAHLNPKAEDIILDATFGAGGYSKAILEAAECKLYAIDKDPSAIHTASQVKAIYGERFSFLHSSFSCLEELMAKENTPAIDGIVFDLGVSSMQLDQGERGFSFAKDGPLDMRMSKEGKTAADAVNNLPVEELARIISLYGEERFAFKVAQAIIAARPLHTTLELANVIRKVVYKTPGGIDPATRTFQGLRIYVNKELEELEIVLRAAEKLLKPEGRLVVVSFHSLEDRIVKEFLKVRSGKDGGNSRHLPPQAKTSPSFTGMARADPSKEEAHNNPRSRSARLRSATRTASLPWTEKRRLS